MTQMSKTQLKLFLGAHSNQYRFLMNGLPTRERLDDDLAEFHTFAIAMTKCEVPVSQWEPHLNFANQNMLSTSMARLADAEYKLDCIDRLVSEVLEAFRTNAPADAYSENSNWYFESLQKWKLVRRDSYNRQRGFQRACEKTLEEHHPLFTKVVGSFVRDYRMDRGHYLNEGEERRANLELEKLGGDEGGVEESSGGKGKEKEKGKTVAANPRGVKRKRDEPSAPPSFTAEQSASLTAIISDLERIKDYFNRRTSPRLIGLKKKREIHVLAQRYKDLERQRGRDFTGEIERMKMKLGLVSLSMACTITKESAITIVGKMISWMEGKDNVHI